jgi:hypothetical protein
MTTLSADPSAIRATPEPRLRAKFALTCDYASLSDGKLNVLGVFEELRPPELPLVLAQMFVVASYSAAAELSGSSVTLGLQLVDPSGAVLLDIDQSVALSTTLSGRPGPRVTINHVSGLGGLRFPTEGDYLFRFSVDGTEMATTSVYVHPPG